MDILISFLNAFLVGGVVCCLGEFFLCRCSICTFKILIFLIAIGVVLGILSKYILFINFGGAGFEFTFLGLGYNIFKEAQKVLIHGGVLKIFKCAFNCVALQLSVSIFLGVLAAAFLKIKR